MKEIEDPIYQMTEVLNDYSIIPGPNKRMKAIQLAGGHRAYPRFILPLYRVTNTINDHNIWILTWIRDNFFHAKPKLRLMNPT